MKTNTKQLRDFIRDFDLENPDRSICFNAMIEFKAAGIYKRMETEIHIVSFTGTSIFTMHLLDPEIVKQNIPGRIIFSKKNAVYAGHKFLTIMGNSALYGAYNISIYPIARKCHPKTTAELRMKNLN